MSSFKLTVGEQSPLANDFTFGLTVGVLFRLSAGDDCKKYISIDLIFHSINIKLYKYHVKDILQSHFIVIIYNSYLPLDVVLHIFSVK